MAGGLWLGWHGEGVWSAGRYEGLAGGHRFGSGWGIAAPCVAATDARADTHVSLTDVYVCTASLTLGPAPLGQKMMNGQWSSELVCCLSDEQILDQNVMERCCMWALSYAPTSGARDCAVLYCRTQHASDLSAAAAAPSSHSSAAPWCAQLLLLEGGDITLILVHARSAVQGGIPHFPSAPLAVLRPSPSQPCSFQQKASTQQSNPITTSPHPANLPIES